MTARLGALYSRRGVLTQLVGRDIRVKYGSSVLGYFWSLLEPLMLTAVYYLVFTYLLDRARFGIEAYALFLILGVLPWLWVSSTISASMRALKNQSRLISKVRIPREIFPLGVVGAKTFEFVMSWFVIIFVAGVARQAPTINILYFPLAFLLEIVLLTGLAFFLSAVNVLLRDVERLTRIILRVGFYMSAVVFPVSRITGEDRLPEWAKILFQCNPLVGIFSLYRSAFYPSEFPSTVALTASTVGAIGMLIIGYWTFIKLEPAVLKEL
jgi:ABC-2 type transport system permease protein